MVTFIGDYNCRLDDKGRVLLPSAFIKQMAQSSGGDKAGNMDHFVLKKDIYEKCLLLYPIGEWERQNRLLRKNTNPYNKEHNRLLRGFFKGIAEVTLDGNNRILIPKRLLDEISAGKDIVMAGQFGKIEIWPRDQYEAIGSDDEQLAALAEKIMGNIQDEPDVE